MDFTNKKTLLGDIYGAEISTQTISSMTYRVLHLHKEGRFGLAIPHPLVVETSSYICSFVLLSQRKLSLQDISIGYQAREPLSHRKGKRIAANTCRAWEE